MAVRVGLAWIPTVAVLSIVIGILISYGMAVTSQHVQAVFPFISDTGDTRPESCIFSQCFNIAAVFVTATAYIRYKLVANYFQMTEKTKHLTRTNFAGLVIGLAVALGISVVGNFQYSAVAVVHLIGALLAIGVGIIYCWLQTVLTGFTIAPVSTISGRSGRSPEIRPITGNCVLVIRLLICLVATATFIVYQYFGNISVTLFTGSDQLLWNSMDGGYTEHIVSTSAQWITVFLVLTYLLIFIPEFRTVRLADSPFEIDSSHHRQHHAVADSRISMKFTRQDEQAEAAEHRFQPPTRDHWGVQPHHIDGACSRGFTSRIAIISDSALPFPYYSQ